MPEDVAPGPGRVAEIVPRLANSRRGKIFLCNLEAALGIPLIDANELCSALLNELHESVRLKDEDELLGCLKKFLEGLAERVWPRRAEHGVPETFSGSQSLVTVMRADDYRYYRDSDHAASNHNYEVELTTPGWTTERFDPAAATREYFWVAPAAVLPSVIADDVAEDLRDRLGLVHYGRGVALIALVLQPPSAHSWCRPTVIEASPNARFRQVHPSERETRWGFTVDLAKLDSAVVGGPISGAPELVLERVTLGVCKGVRFVALGRTESDRATADADRQFLEHVKCGRAFEDVYAVLESAIKAALQP